MVRAASPPSRLTIRAKRKFHTLREVARRLGGEVAGDADVRVHQVGSLENAGPGTIAFLGSERFLQQLRTTQAAAVIVNEAARDATTLPRIVCENPYAYFARVSALLNPAAPARAGRHPTAVVGKSAVLAPGVEIGAHAVIGEKAVVGAGSIIGAGCFIGEETAIGSATRLYPNVTVYHRCVIGDRVIVHSGVVIGADGFGIAMEQGRWLKVPQIGRVVIGNDVEIGANTTVDRGAIDDTVIEDGVKLDNQIQVGHNVRIGAHTAIAACAGIAGSARIGRYCRIGGASGIFGHTVIADHVEISSHTLIMKSIDKPGVYTGAYPFEANANWRKNAAQLRHLSELAERLRALERKILTPERSKP
ncbi:MAG TPA: UDP-3-O-(3-hydroxymyristoyl)glucosamine N-acyltransferase [Burkholderiales bacterium]|nr:UDP-3-O-(3-hydroxymyristoyl)glucosamine N-acyltransferase [Burkholderiales bacterium]